jgi:3-hydroxyisobutyrate dehydrogenase/glyoxylate/succinic semialdehyde reductase
MEGGMKVGFIGLGIMGSRMAANLRKQGVELVIHNRTRSKADDLLNKGAVWADSPAAVAREAEVVFTILAHPDAVTETALGKEGLLGALKPGSLWIECSTVNPSFTRRMAEEARERDVRFLEAPVSGSKNQAAAAELGFLVGGDESDLEACRPLLEMMGKRIVHVGGHGMGISLKLVINSILAAAMVSFSEGIILGQALGVSREMLFKVLLGGPVAAPFLSMKREKLEREEYEPEFSLQWMQKDLQMTSMAAFEAGVPMPVSNVVKEIYRLAIRNGFGEKDLSSIYSFLKT